MIKYASCQGVKDLDCYLCVQIIRRAVLKAKELEAQQPDLFVWVKKLQNVSKKKWPVSIIYLLNLYLFALYLNDSF